MARRMNRGWTTTLVVGTATLVLAGCDSSPPKWGQIELDPTRPTYTIVEASPDPAASEHDFGPFTLMMPAGWTITPMGDDQGYTLAPPIESDVSCFLDVMEWEPGMANDDALADALEFGKRQVEQVDGITNTSLGYVNWPGMPRMNYSRNHREYTNAPSGEYLTFSTYDSARTYTFGIMIAVPEGDPAQTDCYRIWPSLKVE